MKAQITSSPSWAIIEDSAEHPPRSQPPSAQTDAQDTSRRARVKPEEPKWENLTLDELKEWLAEAKREQGITD
jgi:hypothetical protein